MAVIEQDGFRLESTEGEATIQAVLDADKAEVASKKPKAPSPTPAPEPVPAPEPQPSEPDPSPEPSESESEPVQARNADGTFRPHPGRRDSAARMLEALDEAKRERGLREAADARIRELEARVAGQGPAPLPASPTNGATAVPGTRAKPQGSEIGSKYDSYEAYVEDLADWKAEQRIAAALALRDQQAAQQAAMKEVQQALEAHAARVQAERGQYPDWDQAAEAIDAAFRQAGFVNPQGQTFMPAVLHEAVVKSERSGAILHYLGTHVEEAVTTARAVATAHPSVVPYLRRELEAKVAAPVAESAGSTARAVSTAKPPIKPVGSSPIAAVPRADDEDLDFAAFVKAGNEAERQRRRQRRGM